MRPDPSHVFRSPYSPSRQRMTVAVLAFAGMCSAFMQTILIPIQGALPDLLGADPADTTWVITVTLLSAAVSNPITGKLGDMFGKRNVALVLIGLLLSGSLVCAQADSLAPIIAGRALQGLGLGVIPLGISMLRDIVDSDRMGTSISLVSATLGVGGAIGLPISALVSQHADWHVLFLVASVLAALSLLLIFLVVPKTGIRTGGSVDAVGAIGLSVGLIGILLAVSRGNSWGWGSAATLTSLGIGLVTLALWAWYELRLANPLVDLRVNARPVVLTTNLASVAMGFALFSSSVAFPQLLQLPLASGGLGVDLLPASLLLMPAGLAMLAMSPISGRIQRRSGPRVLLVSGAAVLAVAYLACLVVPLGAAQIGIINGVIGVGIGLGYAAMPALIIGAVPRNETGAANGLNTLMRGFGTTLAAALVGSILAGTHGAGHTSFLPVFGLGLIAALICAMLALRIPTSRQDQVAVG